MGNYIKRDHLKLDGWDLPSLSITPFTIPTQRVVGLSWGAAASAGVYPKFNVHNYKNDKTLYIKAGEKGSVYYGVLEPITEYICSKIGKLLGFDVLEYRLWCVDRKLFGDPDLNVNQVNIALAKAHNSLTHAVASRNKVLVSVSDSFLGDDDNFISATKITKSIGKGEKFYETLWKVSGGDTRKKLDQMIVFDYLIFNPDRHTGNFGWIMFQGGLKFAPLYDHALALGTETVTEEIEDHGLDVTTFPMGKPFGNLLAAIDYVDKKNLKGLNFDVSIEEILQVVVPYRRILGDVRYGFICDLLTARWKYVKKVFS